MFIDLTTDEDLSIVRPEDVLYDIVLIRPGLQSWNFMVFAVIDRETKTTTRFLAMLITSSSSGTFKETILTIKKSLSRRLTLKTRIGEFKLNPTFSIFLDFTELIRNNTQTSIALVPTTIAERFGFSLYPEMFIGIKSKWEAFKRSGIHNAITLTSSYFCTQIALLADEYIDLPPYAIKLQHSGRILEHGEFTRVQYSDGTDTVRVCEELMPNGNVRNRLSFITFYGLLILNTYVHLIMIY